MEQNDTDALYLTDREMNELADDYVRPMNKLEYFFFVKLGFEPTEKIRIAACDKTLLHILDNCCDDVPEGYIISRFYDERGNEIGGVPNI